MCEREVRHTRRRIVAGMLTLTAATLGPRRASPQAPVNAHDRMFMQEAERMKQVAVERGDQPYGAIIVREREIIARGVSAVITTQDPTAHAEMQAIREACRMLGTRDLSACVMYGTSRACPMCETAAYWARLSELRYGPQSASAGAPGYPRC